MSDYDINSLIDTKLSKRSKDIKQNQLKFLKQMVAIITEVHFHQLKF